MSSRIGVFVCDCGLNIARTVRVPEVVEFARNLPGVVLAEEYKFMCSTPGQDLIQESITRHNLDRVIVAACSPLMHEKTFRKVVEKAGLNLRIKIILKKRIPIGGGLGGGSSDAASVLKGLNELAGFPFNEASLHSLGCSLGADVPFFLLEAPAALGRGIGTELEVVHVPHGWYVLVYPDFSISTRWAYENYVLTGQDQGTIFDAEEVIKAAMWQNDLEQVISARYPEIDRIKEVLMALGARAALLSGSGSTVFGSFLSQEAARRAASSLEINNGLQTSLVESL